MLATQQELTRRDFLQKGAAACAVGVLSACGKAPERPTQSHTTLQRLFFTSQGRTAIIHADGTGLHYFDFNLPDQVTWQPGPFFADGQRMVFLSMEARRDGPGKPFDTHYHLTPTHLWLYDFDSQSLNEICTKERQAVFYTPALLLSEERLLVQVVSDSGGKIVSMNLDGTDARDFTRFGEGLPYGLTLSPNGKRVAYHLASPQGYQIWTSDIEGATRVQVAAHPDHLYFGPSWSADGEWLLFQNCHFKKDPGHDWSDVCIARPDGSEYRAVTNNQAMWFGSSYGKPGNRGGGSNIPSWTHDGHVLFPLRLPDSKTPWEYQTNQPDTDHFNRAFKPELARGGVEICRLDPATGEHSALTTNDPPLWDFRASESSDGQLITFCRAETGGTPAIWIADADGNHARLLTRGVDDQGADHPRWLPV